jgi:hypothetical protein
MSIGQTLGFIVVVLLLTAFLSNGLIMLISPARWFRLPSYVAFRGSLRERDYMSKLSGRLQIRALGFVFVSFVLYVVSGLLGFIPHFLSLIGSKVDAPIVRSERWLCFMISLAVVGCGFVMLLKPKWWVMKYMSTGETDEDRQTLLERVVRFMSVPILAVGAYFLYHCIVAR